MLENEAAQEGQETKAKPVVVRESAAIMQTALRPQDVKAQLTLIKKTMKSVMVKDEDYGIIPGCKKPSLLKPGAEKLNLLFRLDPQFEREFIELPNNGLEVRSRCTLVHIPTGNVVGHGGGSCSTMEKKYRWRDAERKCPSCGKTGTIIKGREEYGGGWLCFGRKGGCGAKWEDGAKEIELQEVGKLENPDLADCRNTVLKMADKRALIAADLNTTGASAIFTQDIEDLPPENIKGSAAEQNGQASPQANLKKQESNPGSAQPVQARAPQNNGTVSQRQVYFDMVRLANESGKSEKLKKIVSEYMTKAGKPIDKFIEEDYDALIKYIYSKQRNYRVEFEDLKSIISKKTKYTQDRFHDFMNARLTDLNKTEAELTDAEIKILNDRIRNEVLEPAQNGGGY